MRKSKKNFSNIIKKTSGFLKRIYKKKHGLQRVIFWVRMLVGCLCFSCGLRVGVVLSEKTEFAENLSAPFKEFSQQLKNEGPTIKEIGALYRDFFVNLWDLTKTSSVRSWQFLKEKALKSWGILQEDPTADIDVDFSPVWPAILFAVVIIVLIFVFADNYSHKERKSKSTNSLSSPKRIWTDTCMISVLTGVCMGMVLSTINVTILSITVGICTVAFAIELMLVLQDVYVKRNSKDYVYFEKYKKSVLLKTTLLGIALIGLPLWIPGFWGFQTPQLLQNSDLLDYYTAILSLTFISISVMSVLSDRSIIIYWENIAEAKLITPVFGSFAAYTYYSIGAALAAGVCVALNNTTAFVVFCIINISTIILLTYTMVDVYYDRESKKALREKDLEEDFRDYLWVCKNEHLLVKNDKKTNKKSKLSGKKIKLNPKTEKILNKAKIILIKIYEEEFTPNYKVTADENEKDYYLHNKEEYYYIKPDTDILYSTREIDDKKIGYKRYVNKMMMLCQNIHRANDEYDLTYLQEVYELYRKKTNCFNTPEGKQVVNMLFADFSKQNWSLIIHTLKTTAESITENPIRENEPFDESTKNQFNQDNLMWASLAKSEYLREWLQANSKDAMESYAITEFISLVLGRLVVFYNDIVTHYNLQNKNKCEYLKLLWNKEYVKESNEITDCESICILTEKNELPEPEQITTVYDYSLKSDKNKYTLPVTLIRILYITLNNTNKKSQISLLAFLTDLPIMNRLLPLLVQVGIENEEINYFKELFSK